MNHQGQNFNQPASAQGYAAGGTRQAVTLSQPNFTPSYVGYMVRRGQASNGQPGSWLMPVVDPSFSCTSQKAAKYHSRMKGEDVMRIYGLLKYEEQRNVINKILSDQRKSEKNQYATWDLHVILPQRKQVTGALGYAKELISIIVILRRHHKSDPFVLVPGATGYGIADPNTQYVPMPPSYPNNQQGQRNQGGINQFQSARPQGGQSGYENLPPPPLVPTGNGGGAPRVNTNQNQSRGDGSKVPDHGRQFNPRQQPGNAHRNSMTGLDRVQNWQQGYRDSDTSGSEDPEDRPPQPRRPIGPSGPSGAANLHVPPPPPPPGGVHGQQYPNPPRMRPSEPAPPRTPLRKEISRSEIRSTGPRGEPQKRTDTIVRQYDRPRSNDSGSSRSYRDEYSSQASDSTRATDYTYSSRGDKRYHRSGARAKVRQDPAYHQRRPRSHSRDHRSRDRHMNRSLSRERRHHSRVTKRYREHDLPAPYKGLPAAEDSDSDRDRKTTVINNYLVDPRAHNQSPGSSRASYYGNGTFPRQRPIQQYPQADPWDLSGLNSALPQALMVPPPQGRNTTGGYGQGQNIQHQTNEAEAYMNRKEVNAARIRDFKRGERVGAAKADALFNDPVERRNRRAAERYDDDEWESTYSPTSSQRYSWSLKDDLNSSQPRGYGMAGARRDSGSAGEYSSMPYGQAGPSMRTTRESSNLYG